MRDGDLLTVASLTASIVYDFILKIRGIGTLNAEFIGLLPMPPANHPLAKQAEKLILRLNCVTSAYSDLWKDSYPGRDDDGRIESIRVTAGPVPAGWSHEAALRDEHSRWGALCDLDAIAALRLGLRVSDLRSIYRSQFGQLRMYESNTVFDSLGRQLSSIRHNWGIRQHLAESEKTSPAQSVWPAVEQWLTGREVPVPYGFSPPFTRADREAAMSTAYWAYVDKYGLTPPDIDERPA